MDLLHNDQTQKPEATSNQRDAPDSDQDSSLDSGDDIETSPELRLSAIQTDINEAVECLKRFSKAIGNPASNTRFRKLGVEEHDMSYRAVHDISYVKDKFPKVDLDLADFLGRRITRRRQFFRYRKAHHDKLADGLEELLKNREEERENSRTEIVPRTVASSLPQQ
ncbi:hypothetical protein QBC44DRAFT_305540 [Cladorrhinum sp. PSN332]|nr:hypothetical protein QBC44DRAFT_305540 [Cladorrhinum sp. PSN332]